MSVVREACARFLSVFKVHDLDREFDDEARSHLALATEDYVQRGMPLAEAQRLARLKFGSLAASKDGHRASRGLPWLEGVFYDLRFALRGLRRDCTFGAAICAMLALALGLNATVFTVREAVLFRGLPLATRSDRLLYLSMRQLSDMACCPGPVLYSDFEEWRAQARAFKDMSFWGGGATVSLRDQSGRRTDLPWVDRVSTDTFGMLGVRPILGRDFAPADEAASAAPVAILSYRLWDSRFGRRADVIGAIVHINDAPTTIIGVMPERFAIVYEQTLWLPLARTPGLQGSAIGRLKDGATQEQARAELDTINRRLKVSDPTTKRGTPEARTYAAYVGPDAPMIYGTAWVGAWFVLLIACANATNLTLMRTVGRWRELSTRVALGAGLGRIMRQVLVEHCLLAGAAGVVGWGIATWSVRAWARATGTRYLVLDYSVNADTLIYVLVISAFSAILVSLVPIGRCVQLGLAGAPTGDARGMTPGRRGKHLAAGLVAVQVALAIVLLLGAGVLVRSFAKIVTADTGVRDAEHIVVGFAGLPSDTYPNAPAWIAYFDRLMARLRSLPGVDLASVSSTIPTRMVNRQSVEIEGRTRLSPSEEFTQVLAAGPEYFRLMGVATLSGREFNDGDQATSPLVAIVNQRFATHFWPGGQPMGKRLRTVIRDAPGPWRTVIAVVPNIMQGDPTRQVFQPVVYVPFRQQPRPAQFFFVRTARPRDEMIDVVRAEVQTLDPEVTLIDDVATLSSRFAFDRDWMDLEHSELGKHAAVAPIFAVIAVVLAATGLIAMVAHSVSLRTKEIGIRMAIGAAATDVRRMVYREGMRPVTVGLAIGLGASLVVNRILQSQLVGVSPYDPVTMGGAPVILFVVALLACTIPARRAVNVDPVVALRHD